VCFDFIYNFFLKICHSGKNWVRYNKKIYIVLHVKYPLFLWDFNETLIFFFDIFWENIQTSDFMKIHPVGTEFFHADGQTWWSLKKKTYSCFSQFGQKCLKMDLPRSGIGTCGQDTFGWRHTSGRFFWTR